MSAYRGARVLVTGGAGFIGRWVSRALAHAGAEVHVAARDIRAAQDVLTAWQATAQLHPVDLIETGAVGDLVAQLRPAAAFNLAGYGVDRSERDDARAMLLNALLPADLAVAMAKHGHPGWRGQQVVHAGSALEYGTAAGDLAEDGPATPTTLYGRTKLEGTRRLAEACARLGVRGVTARLFTVFGAGEHDGRLLPTLLAAAAGADPIPLTAGTQRRDFTWVGDVADGLLRLGALDAAALGAVNLATGTLTSVRHFVETAAEVLGIAPARLRFGEVPTRGEEMAHDPVNTARLRQLLGGWAPARTIRDAVAASQIR